MTTRAEFIRSAGAAVAVAAAGSAFGEKDRAIDYDGLQKEIDAVTPAEFSDYLRSRTEPDQAALKRLDRAFEKVLAEVRETSVTKTPAVWLVYNMGVVVKTPKTCFSIDLKHRHAVKMAPLLDFALITHNHDDHFTDEFYRAMNGAGKTVISNFMDNYGVRDRARGGYTRAQKTFRLADVEIRTSLADHNAYLVDFTTAFDISANGYGIFHSGDCCNVAKLKPQRAPDLWIVHPRCGMNVADGVRKFGPKLTAIAHLNEFGHAKGRFRWSYADGLAEAAKVKEAGGVALMPLWGDRIVG